MMDSTAETPARFPTVARLISALTQLQRSWVGLIGLGILLFWILAALGAPWLAPFPPNAMLLPFAPPGTRFAPSGVFLLGTDHLGVISYHASYTGRGPYCSMPLWQQPVPMPLVSSWGWSQATMVYAT